MAPVWLLPINQHQEVPPPARGWPLHPDLRQDGLRGSPARAGMAPSAPRSGARPVRFPRPRGDGPLQPPPVQPVPSRRGCRWWRGCFPGRTREAQRASDGTVLDLPRAAAAARQCERDKLLLNLMYRRGLRVSEAVDLRWTDFDLDAPRARPFWVRRLKGSKDTVHTLEPDTVRSLRKAKSVSDGQYVFRSERGGPLSVDAVQAIVTRAGRLAGLGVRCHRT